MKKFFKLTLISSIVTSFALSLGGCATKAMTEMESKVETQKTNVEERLKAPVQQSVQLITYSDASYIPLKKLKTPDFTKAQKKILGTEIEVNRNFATLNEVVAWLTTVTGNHVLLNPELLTQGSAAGGAMGASPAPGAPGMPGGMSGAGSPLAGGGIAQRPISVSYSGTVSGFLDMIAASYGVYWKMDENIRLFITDSKTFRLAALPGDTAVNTSIGTSSTSATSGSTNSASGSSSNSAGMVFSGLSVWTGIETAIRQLLTPGSGKVAVSAATGTVSVTDTPKVLALVEDFINEQNVSLNRQVFINVRVLSVELSNGDNYGINWDSVYSNLTDNVAFKVSTGFTPVAGAASFVLQTASNQGSWGAASGAMITALSSQGRVSELTSSNIATMNNQPAPVNVGRQVSYLASSSTTTTTGAGNTTSLTPGKVSTGFSMVVVPHIMNGRELLLQSSINISSLLNLATVVSGNSSIQSPDLSTSDFIQRVRMRSGETLVVAGFDQDNLSAVSKGVGQAQNVAMGSQAANGKRSMLVVLIQPVIAN